MIRLETRDGVRGWREALGTSSLGLVPTMGALHRGHLSLVEKSMAENDHTVVSVFVNPAQFDAVEDLERYPRDLEGDAELLKAIGCDALYIPTPREMYPPGFETWVEVANVARPLEGKARAGHFRGVATVVLKLFNQTRPTRAYFGEKDRQQLVVIRTMARDLDLAVEVVGCPTVREPDGLAMSSRNLRLDPGHRSVATALFAALTNAADAFGRGERDPAALRELVVGHLRTRPQVELEYISAADPDTLVELEGGTRARAVLLSLAAFVGGVRLIDNILLTERVREEQT